jgi:hypothetical protein
MRMSRFHDSHSSKTTLGADDAITRVLWMRETRSLKEDVLASDFADAWNVE